MICVNINIEGAHRFVVKLLKTSEKKNILPRANVHFLPKITFTDF